MKRAVAAVMIGLVCLLGVSAGASDIQTGISQYRWGESTARYPELTKVGEKGEVSYYSKAGETYAIGNVVIDKVIYGFYRDQLFGVYLNLDSIEIYDKLLSHLKSLYGLPAVKASAGNSFVSKWKQENITIKLKIHEPDRKMKLAYYYRPLSGELNAEQWEELDVTSFRFVPIEKGKKPEKFILFEF